MKMLETDRLVLRAFTMEDLNDFYEYCKDPDTGIHAGWKPHESIEESREILLHQIKVGNIWAICEKKTGKNIGAIWLRGDFHRTRSEQECRVLGYILRKSCWGQGFMTEAAREVLRYAFEELGLQLVSTYRFPYNQRSGRVMEKVGFTYEGTLRQCFARYDGALLDFMCYSMTKEEYLQNKQ